MLSEVRVLIVAIAAAYVATAVLVPMGTRIGFVAGFNPIVPQKRPPAALGGGLGILAGLAAGIVFAEWTGQAFDGGLRAAIAVVPPLLVGLADDAHAMSPRRKLSLQFVSAALGSVIMAGLPRDLSDCVAIMTTTFCAVTLMNAFNFLDVSDGYAGGIAAVSFAGFGLCIPENTTALAAAGACIGFLGFNLPPARIYMGDAGSHCLGMLGAIQIVAASTAVGPVTAISVSAACFGFALLELSSVTIFRWYKGLSIWRGSPHHSALQLQQLGLSKLSTLLLASVVQGGMILCWWLVSRVTAG